MRSMSRKLRSSGSSGSAAWLRQPGGQGTPRALLTWLTLLSTVAAGSGELSQLRALLQMKVVPAREPRSGVEGTERGRLLRPGREREDDGGCS